MTRRKILILAVNPKDTVRLRLDQEVKIIREALRHFTDRHDFEVQEVWAVTIEELQRELLEHSPYIVHFCGHADNDGLLVEDEKGLAVHVPPAALGNLFRLCRETIGMVFLNACESASFAGEIQQHIPYVIAMRETIIDRNALAFVRGVYEAVAAGRSFDDAFELGRNAMDLRALAQSDIPLLLSSEPKRESREVPKPEELQRPPLQAASPQHKKPDSAPQVFICYAHEDWESARGLYDDLKSAGFQPWMDSEDLRAGQRWRSVINQAIKDSQYVLLLLSTHSISKRGFVQKEMRKALSVVEELPPDEVFLIPVRLEQCEPQEELLQELQWIDLFHSYERGFQRLLRDMGAEILTPGTGKQSPSTQPQTPSSQSQTPSPQDTSSRDYFENIGGNVYTGPVTIYHGSSPQPAEDRQQSAAPKNESPVPSSQLSELGLPLQEFSFETVKVNAQGEIVKREHLSAQQYLEELGNGVTLEMVYVPGGTFLMGAPESEQESYGSERPQHQVTLSPFLMGKYPITQKQWQAVMGNNPSHFKGAKRPVETVSWHDAQEFCQKLSQKTGAEYRLPTEAEWEYACRAGTNTPLSFGERITTELANYEFDREETSNVGSFFPNAFGLYDMHGNIWEWCADWFDDRYYTESPTGNPTGPASGSKRVIRGCAWGSDVEDCRAASRRQDRPDDRSPYVGFRLARSISA